MIDKVIADIIVSAGVEMILSVPCNMLSGILTEISSRPVLHIPVCREEEGVGIAAGAALAGKKPMLLMQNSGLGNSVNALMSLTQLYRLPLFIMMSHRGGFKEQIAAQMPMGKTVPQLLERLKIESMHIRNPADLEKLYNFIKKTFENSTTSATLLSKELWDEAQ